MYKLHIKQADNAGTTIQQEDPHMLLLMGKQFVDNLPGGSVETMVLTHSVTTDFDTQHFELTKDNFNLLSNGVIGFFCKVMDEHPDYERLRKHPMFIQAREGIAKVVEATDAGRDQTGGLALNAGVKQLRQIALIYATQTGLITQTQALEFLGFPINVDYKW